MLHGNNYDLHYSHIEIIINMLKLKHNVDQFFYPTLNK